MLRNIINNSEEISSEEENRINNILINIMHKKFSQDGLSEDWMFELCIFLMKIFKQLSRDKNSKELLKPFLDFFDISWDNTISGANNILNIIRFMIMNGLDVTKTADNETLLDYACKLGSYRLEVVRLILEAGAVTKDPDDLIHSILPCCPEGSKTCEQALQKDQNSNLYICLFLILLQQREFRKTLPSFNPLRLPDNKYEELEDVFNALPFAVNTNLKDQELSKKLQENVGEHLPSDLVKVIASYDPRSCMRSIDLKPEPLNKFYFFSPKVITGGALAGALVGGLPGMLIGITVSTGISFAINKENEPAKLYKP